MKEEETGAEDGAEGESSFLFAYYLTTSENWERIAIGISFLSSAVAEGKV